SDERRCGLQLEGSYEHCACACRRLASACRFEIERRVMLEDCPLELLQLRPRLDSQLVDQRSARRAVRGEGVGLSATAVAGEHLQGAGSLAEWVLGRQLFELAHELGLASASEIRLDASLESHEPELVEPGGCLPQDAFVDDVCQGWTTPEPKRLSQERRRVLG